MARLIPIADWTGKKSGNVVFIHGLGGHPYDTWRRGADDETFWPLWLAQDVPGLAVFSYGYVSPPTGWLGTSMPLLDEAALALRILLASPDLKSGPICLVCHSLGGLIAKALLRAAREQASDPAISDFLSRVQQVVFIATPHTGAGKATLLEKLAWLTWPSASARNLVANRADLRDLNFGYRTLVEASEGRIAHHVYYEMKDTFVGGIVSPASADPGLPRCKPTPLPEDHITIAKPTDRQALVYLETKGGAASFAATGDAATELRAHAEQIFRAPFRWAQIVPVALRMALIGALVWGGWRGVPRLYAALTHVEKTADVTKENLHISKEMQEQIKQLTALVIQLQTARSGQPVDEASKAAATERIGEAIKDIAKAPDARSKAAFEAMQRRDITAITAAENLFQSVLDEKAKEGQSANREAAEAARNLAAFKRLTDVTAARDLYARAATLEPDRFATWIDLGDMRRASGDTSGALASYLSGQAVATKAVAAQPKDAAAQRNLSVSYERIGYVRNAQGDLAGALKAYQDRHVIAETLSSLDPGNTQWQRDLSVSHNRIGNVRMAQGDLAGALTAYQASLAIREALSRRDPGNTEWQRDLSVSHNRIGDVRRAQGDLTGALTAYQASHAIRETLSRSKPDNTEWQRDLSVSHNRIGNVRMAQGDLTGALTAYQASLGIRETLSPSDPDNKEWQRDLSVSHEKIGDVRRAQGDLAGALTAYQASLAISETLSRRDPGNTQWQRDLSVSALKVAFIKAQQGDKAAARAGYARARDIIRRLIALSPTDATLPKDLSWLEDQLATLDKK